MRIGHGFDIHAFGGLGPLIIGGVIIPYKTGVIAHSDGDVLFHSLTDSLLGASALGDIGTLYPNNNKSLKGIKSSKILCEVWELIKNKGYSIKNIDITIIVETPKMIPYIFKIKKNISKILNINMHFISIKATSTEKLGFIGRSEGIACESVVLISK